MKKKLLSLILGTAMIAGSLFPALTELIYDSFCKVENEISNVVNYKEL